MSRLGRRHPGIAVVGVLILAAAAGSMARVGPGSPPSDAATSNSYSPPRTPWGDPDLQGAFSNSDKRGIPMSRPEPAQINNSRPWLVSDPPDGKSHEHSRRGARPIRGALSRHRDHELHWQDTLLSIKRRLKLVERFTPIAQNVLQWSVTLIDDRTWPTPWTLR